MKTSGNDIIYFLVPIAILVLLIIATDWIIIMEMKYYIGSHDDYVYSRAPYFIYRQSGFVGVCIVSFFLGNMSMATGGVGSYSYLFAGFFAIQSICRFYSHFVWNYEVWDWKKYNDAQILAAKKEEESRFKNDINDNQKNRKKYGNTAVTVDINSSGVESDFESSAEEDETVGIDDNGTMKSLDRMSGIGIDNLMYDENETTCEEEPLSMYKEVESEEGNDDDKKESEDIDEGEFNADDENPLTDATIKKGKKKKKKKRKVSLMPRMTKAALARIKKNEEEMAKAKMKDK